MTEWWRIHPSLRGGGDLSDRATCAFEVAEGVDPPAGARVYECGSCGRRWTVYGPGDPPDDIACQQMKPSRLRSVSPDRDRKRRERGTYGPLCEAVRGQPCHAPGCLDPSDPCHVRSVGSGRADFLHRDGRWIGNVAPFCRTHHRFLDGEIGGGGSPQAFEDTYGVDPVEIARMVGVSFCRKHGIDSAASAHPYDQLSEMG